MRQGGAWIDMQVLGTLEDGTHELQQPDGEQTMSLALHPWNHGPRELPCDVFEPLCLQWRSSLHAQHAHITDALSGRKLNVLEQCVAIDVVGSAEDSLHPGRGSPADGSSHATRAAPGTPARSRRRPACCSRLGRQQASRA